MYLTACCIGPPGALRADVASLLQDAGWQVVLCDSLHAPQSAPGGDGGLPASLDLVVIAGADDDAALLDLVARVRAFSAAETVPIVLFAADDDGRQAGQALAAGVTEVFAQPHRPDFRTYLQSFAEEAQPDLAGCTALLVEDDPIQGYLLNTLVSREGLHTTLVTSAEQALELIATHSFDVLVTDLVLGLGQSGVNLIRRLRQSESPSRDAAVIAISGFEDDARRLDALRAGAAAFLQKPVMPAELGFHLRRLLQARAITAETGAAGASPVALSLPMLSRLTEREQLICALAAAGHRDKQIAHELGISYWTVRTHLARIFRKFNVANRVELAAVLRPVAVAHAGADGEMVGPWQNLAPAIIEQLPFGVIVTDEQSRILRVNHAYCQISGYGERELLGASPRLLHSNRHPPDFYRKLQQTLTRTGRWCGNVWNRSKNGRDYLGRLDICRLPAGLPDGACYFGILVDVTEEHARAQLVREQSLQDPLTGLPNRVLLGDRVSYEISRAQRTKRRLALAFIDLDGFKPVNDTHGHEVGDQVLQEIAARLSARLREHDTLARIGGDEFVALLPDVEHHEAARTLCQRLLDSFRVPFGPRGSWGQIGASIGVSVFPEDGEDYPALLRHADRAMYQAKQAGGARVACHVPECAAAETAPLQADRARLDAALANDEFELLFQPQFDLDENRIVAAEALLRWRDPQIGLLTAAHFIPVAERSGCIARLGGWALHQACAALQRMQQAGFGQIRIAVNVSPLQILRGKPFAEEVLASLQACGVGPDRLELEVSEGAFLHDPRLAVETLGALAAQGVAIALDGIGKDHFSPGFLRHLPFTTIKIDRNCAADAYRDAYHASILRSSLLLAQGLGVRAVAEGVEHPEQLAFLQQTGCKQAQGNLFAPPLALADLASRLTAAGVSTAPQAS